ncbi:UDP-N-acetylglucosamine-peptide N-acetylglucosaminyltransferase [Thraustotheca clavata]|uniref:UDP-N-acetylglucosamine-peptide N-acetylglucosaminyltransferase n=1 Tax=Thraustotheca clavata TaxID=74557 RepID=A0A1V9Z0W1_9STRA|nr:UDP-N-acetylglucosamine-peptide N-acetylglucosaminyltransferase [Thraustotheca clavata]
MIKIMMLGWSILVHANVLLRLGELYETGKMLELERMCQHILTTDPTLDGRVYELLGVAQYTLGRLKDATMTFRIGLEYFPQHPTMWLHLGDCYLSQLKITLAIQAFETAIYDQKLSNHLHKLFKARNWIAQWNDREIIADQVHEAITTSLSQSIPPIANAADCADFPPEIALEVSRYAIPSIPNTYEYYNVPLDKNVLKIGFISSDFGLHPVATLIRGLVSMLQHKPNFQVYCFALSDQSSWWRKNITQQVHAMISLNGMNVAQAAKTIYNEKIHILIDLNGHTLHSGLPILSYRPAPIQVSFLGFPLSTGCEFIDYFLVDPKTSPPSLTHTFSEKLLYIPQNYIVNDHKQMMRHVTTIERLPTRIEAKLGGILPSAIIFATFSNWQKIDPKIFIVWMHILQRVPNSVMWFMKYPGYDAARYNLINEANLYGVDGENRLVFTELSPWINHIWIKQAADIVLDTSLKNGHTTLIDALWAGVPVITLEGDRMSNRVGSSATFYMHRQLHEVMTMNSYKDYEEMAVKLALSSSLRSTLRKRVQAARLESLLFDTNSFTYNFAQSMQSIWNQYSLGQEPMHTVITATKAKDDEPILLHIGGQISRDGWRIIDIQKTSGAAPDIIAEMHELDKFSTSSVTAIYSSHTLEHVGYGEHSMFAVDSTLKEWFRVLQPGGALFLSVPDLDTFASLLLDPKSTFEDKHHVMRMIYGGQIDAFDYHKVGFNFVILKEYLRRAGFCRIKRVRSFGLFNDTSEMVFKNTRISVNVAATACKSGQSVNVTLPTIVLDD